MATTNLQAAALLAWATAWAIVSINGHPIDGSVKLELMAVNSRMAGGYAIEGIDVHYKVGDTLSITCFVEGYNLFNLSWWEADQIVFTTNDSGSYQQLVKLKLGELTAKDDGRQFTCRGETVSEQRTVVIRNRITSVNGSSFNAEPDLPSLQRYSIVMMVVCLTLAVFAVCSVIVAVWLYRRIEPKQIENTGSLTQILIPGSGLLSGEKNILQGQNDQPSENDALEV